MEKGINHMLDAIQQGILTDSTKQRLQDLEQQKAELSVQIMKEETSHPHFSREQFLFWFERLRKLDIRKLEHRRRLIDIFVNAIFLYDNKMVLTFNNKEGSKTITFEDLEKSDLGSDLSGLGAPLRVSLQYLRRYCEDICILQMSRHIAFSPFFLSLPAGPPAESSHTRPSSAIS